MKAKTGFAMALAAAMLTPGVLLAQTPTSVAQAAEGSPLTTDASDWRLVAAENLLVIDTNRGRILVEMTPEVAPQHVARIRLLAGRGFYDGIVWHRVIDWFMAQTGDPLGTGEGQSPYPDLKGEFTFRRGPSSDFVAVASPLGSEVGFMGVLPVETQPDSFMGLTADGRVHGWGVYCPGVAGMARDDDPDTANSQFFLMRHAYPSLDKRYTVWGRVVSGGDVVRAIKVGDGANGAVTAEPDRMTRVRVASDLEEGQRPVVRTLNPRSVAFRQQVDAVRQARGADFSVCDIEPPVRVESGAD